MPSRALLATAVVAITAAVTVVLPVIRDPGLDGSKNLTLVPLVWERILKYTCTKDEFMLKLRSQAGTHLRTVLAHEKTFLVDHKMAKSNTRNDQLWLVGIGTLSTVLSALGVSEAVVQCIRGFGARDWSPEPGVEGQFPLAPRHLDCKGLGFAKGKGTRLGISPGDACLKSGSNLAREIDEVR